MKSNRRKIKKNGFTLIEILLVISLVSLISAALYNALSNGLKIWERSKYLYKEEDVAIFFEKITHELKSAVIYSKLKFEGTQNKISFPAIVKVYPDKKMNVDQDVQIDQIGRVEYYFDYIDKSIYRRQAGYGQALSGVFDEPILQVKAIKDFKFNYLYLNDDGEQFSESVLEVEPYAIEIEVIFEDKFGERVLNKFVNLPIIN